MTNEELKNEISTLFPSVSFDETGEFLTILISSDELLPILKDLKNKHDFLFDYLFCLTCIDWKDHLMMVYHLNSRTIQHSIVVKAKIENIDDPKIESVFSLWIGAELLEDEVFDLFGVNFINHPNLRRIFLEEDWIGFPLRKNYVDEHMIKL
jgi:NADH-quinone oxidoreductase subunit C